MTSVPHEPATIVRRQTWIDAREMWASLVIVAIWVAVAISAAFGPNMRTFDVAGSGVSIPSGIFVALFAMFATMSVAKRGFDRKDES
jgi:hypothetical protein